jgi:hypothetical protein
MVLMAVRQREHYGTGQWKKIRLSVLARDGYICAYCGNGEANTVDHIISLAKGGAPYDLDNLVACCLSCNSAKGDKNAFFFTQSSTPPASQTHISPCFTLSSTPKQPICDLTND